MPAIEKKDVCVLIPAYNEEKNIALTVHGVREKGFRALVLDDGSKDSTAERARVGGAEVLTAKKNAGKGAALRSGFDWALEKSFRAVILMDADGQHDPADLELFMEALDRADVIIGNRMHRAKNMPAVRYVTNRILSLILSGLSGQKVPDSQCGYRAVKREVLEKIRLRTSHFEIESEMILDAARLKYKLLSVPVRCVYAGEKSSIHPMRDTFRFFNFLFRYSCLKNKP